MRKISKFTGGLFDYQQDVLDKLKNNDSVLVYHGLGSGKTATSIAASEGDKSDVVVPASLRGNYHKELNKFTTTGGDRNVMSYQKFLKQGPTNGASTLIIDEPQKIGRTSSQISQSVVSMSKGYKKRILLTGTPASNGPAELAPIIRTLNPEAKNIPLSPIDFNKKFIGERPARLSPIQYMMGMKPGLEYYPKHTNELKAAIKGRVSYYEPTKEGYPSRINEIKKVEASKEQKRYYSFVTEQANPIIARKIRKNLPLSKQESVDLNAFASASRQVSDSVLPFGGKEEISPKLSTAVNDFESSLKSNPNHKGLIYSNYIASGLDPIAKQFDKKSIPYAKFTGELNDKQKKQAVEDYNSGKVKAMLVSSAGSEGLDLKGTRSIQLLEPHWNHNRIEQVIGRGIRYGSHAALPENERNVRVIKYETILPKTLGQSIFLQKRSTSADEYLEGLSNKKQKTLDKFLDIFKQEGMNKQSSFDILRKTGFADELEKISLSKQVLTGAAIGSGIGAATAFIPKPYIIKKFKNEDSEDFKERASINKEERRAAYWAALPRKFLSGAVVGSVLGGLASKL